MAPKLDTAVGAAGEETVQGGYMMGVFVKVDPSTASMIPVPDSDGSDVDMTVADAPMASSAVSTAAGSSNDAPMPLASLSMPGCEFPQGLFSHPGGDAGADEFHLVAAMQTTTVHMGSTGFEVVPAGRKCKHPDCTRPTMDGLSFYTHSEYDFCCMRCRDCHQGGQPPDHGIRSGKVDVKAMTRLQRFLP